MLIYAREEHLHRNFTQRNGLWVPEAPNIIRGGRTREFEIASPRIGVSGYYKAELIRGGKVIGTWEGENLITNAGLDAIVPFSGTSVLSMLSHMAVGTNSTAPANTDTALGAEISPSSSNRTNANGSIADVTGAGASNAYLYLRRVRLFTETQGNGNLTELGWFTASTGGTMFSRMLFKDGGGTPTTITKTSSDQLRVTYEYRIYPPADIVSTVTISAVSYDYRMRAVTLITNGGWPVVNTGTGAMGGNITEATCGAQESNTAPSATTDVSPGYNGTNTARTSFTAASYTNGTFLRDATIVWDPGIANFATGIGAILLSLSSNGRAAFWLGFTTTKLPKDNTKRLTLNVRYTWGRH